MAGVHCCDCCFSQHASSCMWLLPQPRLPQLIGFSPTLTKLTMQTVKKKKKVLRFEFALALKSLEQRFEKANRIFQKLHALYHML